MSPTVPEAWFEALLGRAGEDGRPRFSREEVHDFIAVSLLSAGFDHATVGPQLLSIVEAYAAKAGVTAEDSRAEAEGKLAERLRRRPIRPDLASEVHRLVRESTIATAGSAPASFAPYLAQAARSLRSSERPPNTVPAGPLARFNVAAVARPQGEAGADARPVAQGADALRSAQSHVTLGPRCQGGSSTT
jgi:hypothetical protein